MNVTLFQAVCENRGPIIALPSRSTKARPPTTPRGPPAPPSPTSRWPRGPTTTSSRPRRSLVGPEAEADHDQGDQRGGLGEGERVLDRPCPSSAPGVEGRQDGDQRGPRCLLGREAEGVAGRAEVDRLDQVAARGDRRGQKTPRNLAKATATAAMVPVWTTRNVAQPNMKPTDGPVRLAEEDVLAAGPGHHRGDLGGAEGAGDGEQAPAIPQATRSQPGEPTSGPTRPR